MSDDQGTLELLGRHLALALRPLRDGVTDRERFRALLYQLGWDPSDLPPAWAALGTAIDEATARLDALGDPPTPEQITDLLTAARSGYHAIQGIATAPPGVDPAVFLTEIEERLFELLLTQYLAAALPSAYNVLQMLNVIQLEHVTASGERPSFVRVHFKWAEIPKIVREPAELPARVYGWGTASLNVDRIVDHLSELLCSLRVPVRIAHPSDELVGAYLDLGPEPSPTTEPSLVVPLGYVEVAGKLREIGLILRALPAANGKLPGLVVEPELPESLPLTFPLTDNVTLRVLAGTNVATTVGILIRPDGIAIKYPFEPGTAPPSAGIGVGLDFTPATPTLLLGAPNETRLEFQGASADFAATSINGEFDASLGAQLKGLALILAPGEGDSFLRTILGGGTTRVDIPLGVEWSRRHGVRFTGSGAFEVSVHPHLQLGPVAVEEVTVRLALPASTPPDLRLELGLGISGHLGPLGFMVEGVGLQADATFADGNVGPFDLQLGFKPPNGMGLSIDAGGFTGGGFLICDSAKGEYAGGLELEYRGFVSVKAIGILNTKLPDGSPGFSLLILITAEFPPIQLGFGFTLLGVGGLLGLNHTVALDVLEAGVRDGSLTSILFPSDIVANAPRIINDLKRAFPPLPDRFLVGPMGKLGWGTPTLIRLEIGVILEIPRPVISVIGLLRMTLPAEEAPLLALQVAFLGVVDFDKGQLSFDASLFDSHLMTFPLSGDMAVRAYWGENANLLLTVGGFHPAYVPPPLGLPALRRVSIVLCQGNPSLRADAYFALTSNTVQFGAKVELSAGASVFNIYGFLALDVLIQIDPFHFIAQVGAMLAVRTGSHTLFSVKLALTLEGPTPWHATGKASFEIGFVFTITISVHFDVTFGDNILTALAPIVVLLRLTEALGNPGNWRAVLPPGIPQSVSLRELTPDPAVLVVQPFGALEVSQKVVPLDLTISRFGAQRPDHGTTFRITDVGLGPHPAETAAVTEQFAPAQFLDMSDAEKLSRKSFERFHAGVRVGGGDLPAADYVTALDVVYEVIYIPEGQRPVRFKLTGALFDALVRGAAVARSAFSRARRAPSPLATPKVTIAAEQFGVATTSDLALHAPSLVFDTEAEAHQALARLGRSDPALSRELQVVPMYEVRAA